MTGVSVSKRSLEQILPDAALDFDAFYQQRSVAAAAGSIRVAAVDGKGIPVVKPCGAQPTARLTKGQKADKKRMATVAFAFTGAPWLRPHNKSSKAFSPPPARHPMSASSLTSGEQASVGEFAQG